MGQIGFSSILGGSEQRTGGDGVFNTPNKVVDNFKWTKKSKAFFPLYFSVFADHFGIAFQ